MNRIFLCALLLASFGTTLFAQPIWVDSSFANNGTRTFGTAGSAQDFNCMLLLDNDQILAAGYSSAGGANRFMVVGLTPNGAINPAFGVGGELLVNVAAKSENIRAMALQPNGMILAAGFATAVSDTEDIAIIRFDALGNLDPTFGNGGTVVTDVDDRADLAFDIAVQSTGHIMVAGWDRRSTTYRQLLLRYQSDGQLDTTFGNGGNLILSLGGGNNDAPSLALSPGDLPVITSRRSVSGDSRVQLARFLLNGQPDSTFGLNGIASLGAAGLDFYAKRIVTLPDGRMAVAGQVLGGANQEDYFLMQVQPDGNLDTTFGNQGFVVYNHEAASRDLMSGNLVRLPDGSMMLNGSTLLGSTTNNLIVKFLPSGQVDSTFGSNGAITYQRAGLFQTIDQIGVQSTGNVVGAGNVAGDGLKGWVVRFRTGNSVGIEGDVEQGSVTLFPNPMNDRGTVRYQLKRPSAVRARVLDATGRTVLDLSPGMQAQGEQELSWTQDLPAGLYVLVLEAGAGKEAIRFIRE